MKYLVICPFNRKEQYQHVLNMWQNQATKSVLCLVANNLNIFEGCSKPENVVWLVGQASIGGARNAGVEYAKSHGYEWCIFFDDDNYYSPNYIKQINDNIDNEIDILSQGIGFVRLGEDLHLFSYPINFYPGHCTAFRTEISLKFPEWNLAEDVCWSDNMKKAGFKAKHLPPWHSIYVRNLDGNGHAYCAPKGEFMKNFGASKYIGPVKDSFVDNESDISNYQLVTATDEEVFESLKLRSIFSGFGGLLC